jgi:hypothetical protein
MEYIAAAQVGVSIISSVLGHRSQEKQNKIAAEANRMQAEELQRMRKLEVERQRRENEELMNSVSNLTNTSFSGVSSPSIDYDKYGDLG